MMPMRSASRLYCAALLRSQRIASGLLLGLLGSFAFTRVTGTLVFGVTTGDAGTFAWMAALLALVSLLALAIPLRAATRVDALAAIRHD